MTAQQRSLTQGSIISSLLYFAMPILIANIFQQLYNTADTTIVGHYLGESALAAVGATASIFELIVGFALGIGNGMSIIVAKNFGAKAYTQLKKATAGSIIIGIVISFSVMLVGHFGLIPLLHLLNTPSNILDTAYRYIYIVLMFVGITFAYNLGAALLRAIGNSLAPLCILIFTSVLNVGLDILLITHYHLGVEGAAIATVMSQSISAVLCYGYIYYRAPLLLPTLNDFKVEWHLYKTLLIQGLSMGLMSSIVSIGSVILQTSINHFGMTIIGAQTTARRIMFFFMLPFTSLAAALTTFVSQNNGAQKPHRIRRAIIQSYWLCVGWGITTAVIILSLSPSLIQLISGSSDAYFIQMAYRYLIAASPFFWVLGILLCTRNSLQGLGRTLEAVASSVIELIGKISFVLFIIPHVGYTGVTLTEPIIWVLMTLQLTYSFFTNPTVKYALQSSASASMLDTRK